VSDSNSENSPLEETDQQSLETLQKCLKMVFKHPLEDYPPLYIVSILDSLSHIHLPN